MRVTYICADPGVPVFGCKGSSIHVQEVLRALLAQGATVELLATRFGGEPPPDLSQVSCVALPSPPKADPRQRERHSIAANDALKDLLASRARPDIVYERYSLWSRAGMEWARDNRVPGLLEVNAPLIDEQATHRNLFDRPAAEMIARTVFAAATEILAVSSGVATYLEGLEIARGKIRVVQNGVNCSRFVGLTPSQAGDTLTIGFVGTLKPWHGLDTLIEAAALTRRSGCRLRLLIVGDGPERGAVEAGVAAAGLEQDTEFTGAVDPDRIPALVGRMDVAVAPYPASPDFYFSPLKIMEYMAAGRAIAASRIGDIEGLIDDGTTGLLCAPGDPIALSQALIRLHTDPDLRTSLGAAARTYALRNLGWERVATLILDHAGRRVPEFTRNVTAC